MTAAPARFGGLPHEPDPGASGAPYARFDDLRGGTALLCPQPDAVLVATRPDEVVGVLAEVERCTSAGRWAYGYVAYEAAAGLGTGLDVHPWTPFDLPLVWFGICGEPLPVPVLAPVEDAGPPPRTAVSWSQGWTPAAHAERVAAIKERIGRGDTYQCNLTERMTGHLDGDPWTLYRELALGQRGSYNAYLDLGPWVIASASPELFFERRGDEVLLRPMKGTAARGRFAAEDRGSADALRASEKERAENLMIVDLMRNDVARIARTGTVAVPSLHRVERYETVLQLTSDVTASLTAGTGLVELFTALFPCGSVTGAPKASTMAIIRELEQEPRGVYCGAVGLVGPPHAPVRARFSVAIRTAVVDTATREAVYGTGGGITWDSDPAAEEAEMVAKSAVLSCRSVPFSLVETLRHMPATGPRHLERHLQRLADSAEHLQFRCDLTSVRRALEERLADCPESRVRIRLDRDGRVAVDVEPPPPPTDRIVELALDDQPVDPRDWRLFHKTTQREPYDSRRGRRPDVDDVIMLNVAGELTEATVANLALELDGQWWTPPLSSGCLPGVERARLLELGVLRETVLRPADLDQASGLAVLSSLRGWRPARLAADAITSPG